MGRNWSVWGVITVMLGVALVAQMGCASPRTAAESPVAAADGNDQEERMINVSGSGTASARPDEVALRLGVETTAETAREAVAENSEQMTAVIDALREGGVPEENIQTQMVRLQAQYETVTREPREDGQRELVGYTASNIVEARTADLEAVGQLLDAAVAAGANRIEGLRFELSDPAELLEQARKAAWGDAEEKATQLAELAGVELGEVRTIDEATTAPRPVPRAEPALEAELAVPIEPGTEEIRVDLQVTWFVH